MAWLNEEQWSKPIRMSEAWEQEWWRKVPLDKNGVYRLIALTDNSDLIPAPINRVCGTDETGTIYIGSSDSLKSRLDTLVMAHNAHFKTKSRPPFSKPLSERFPDDKLAMSWEFTGESGQRENELLKAYVEAFGELPPLNKQEPPINSQKSK
jgi:predicted GIY-YIG superfamily endonuclease